MGSGGSQQLLLVSPDPVDPTDLESQLSDTSVVHLPTLPRVFEELTTGVYDCLVLPATIRDQAGTDLARGIATMYPDLPIVVVGTDPPEETETGNRLYGRRAVARRLLSRLGRHREGHGASPVGRGS
jgi:hypothetical protein